MNNLNLQEPKRQSLIGVAIIFTKNIRRGVGVLLSLLAVKIGSRSTDLFGLDIKEWVLVLIVIFLVISYLQYLRFFFYVRDDKFIVEKGLFNRERIVIPFERIQTVNIDQNLIQQILGVVALKVDTAGSSRKELEISALEKSYGRALQNYLIEQKEEAEDNTEINKSSIESSTAKELDENFNFKTTRPPLVKHGLKNIFLIGLTENHFRTALVLVGVVYGYLYQFQDYFLEPLEPYLQKQANVILAQWLILLPLAIIIFLIVAVGFSIIQSVLRYFELRFFVDERGVQLVSGLLKRREYQVPFKKIQYLKWKINPLRKLAGIQTLIVKQASSEDQSDRKSLKVPGVRQRQLQQVLDEFYPERHQGQFYFIKAHPLLFLQRALWLVVIPSLGLSTLALISPLYLVPVSLFCVLGVFLCYKYYRSVVIGINNNMLMLKKGWLTPAGRALKFYKLQNIKLRQSIFQKRRELASITFYTAAGDETVPHIALAEARQIYDYSLYKIESSALSWM